MPVAAITEAATLMGAPAPAIVDDTVVAAFSSGELFALQTLNGRVVWVDSLTRTGRATPISSLNDIDGHPVIDRGFVYAIAHIRGGKDKGYGWYKAGKMMNKKNTFADFITAARHLAVENFTSEGNIVAHDNIIGPDRATCQLEHSAVVKPNLGGVEQRDE